MMRLHWKVISFATAAVLRLITRGLSPAENSTANRVAAPPAKSLLKLLWKHRTTGEGMCEIEPQMGSLTPFTQSSAASDADLTRRIRRALVQVKYLSTLAKKIITKDGSVTLRAPVWTQQEQTTMAHNARQVAGADRADDQLDILHR